MTAPAGGGGAALEISGLHLAYGPVVALDDIALEVREGEFIALLGPSGCGKTSLLRSVAGYVQPQRGVLRIHGRDVLQVPPRRRNIGMVFQNYALFPHMTAAENVGFGLRCRGVPAAELRAAVARALEMVGLTGMAERRPRALSGGQQQRVALARALVIQPELLLLDEALSALDKQLRVQMQTELRTLQRQVGISTVFVTHDQEEAMAMADRIAVMRGGRIEQLDTPRRLFQMPANAWVADFVGGGNLIAGVLRHGPDGAARVEGLPGLDCAAAPEGAADGARVTAFVRADRVALEPAAEGEPALVVNGRRFLGSRVEVHARHGAVELKALLPAEDADRFDIDARVRARVAARDCRLLPEAG